jgi:hypothetical protein
MKRIKRFENFIEESYLEGSHAPLYHTTSIYFASEILDADMLKSTKDTGFHISKQEIKNLPISFTRDKDFIYDEGPVTFILDQDKLKENYKIKSYDWLYSIHAEDHTKKADPKRGVEFESEETVYGRIENLHKYLTEVRLNPRISIFKNAKPNTREEYREAYEDLMVSLKKYTEKYNIKVVDNKGNEVPLDVEELTEGIYNKNSGTRVYYTKAADEDSYRVYYSSYKPIVGKTPDEFMKFLKGKGIEHTKAGGNAVKMNKAGIDKLKKSMLNLD